MSSRSISAQAIAASIASYKVLVEQYGMTVVTRTTRGDDIAAACGQLAGQVNDRKLKAQIEAAEREALRADDKIKFQLKH